MTPEFLAKHFSLFWKDFVLPQLQTRDAALRDLQERVRVLKAEKRKDLPDPGLVAPPAGYSSARVQ